MNTNRNKYVLLNIVILFNLIIFSFAAVAGQQKALRTGADNALKAAAAPTTLTAGEGIYEAGESAAVTGEGFNKFEAVTIVVETIGADESMSAAVESWTVYADENGIVDLEWRVPFEGQFVIKATGTESLRTAETMVICPVVVSGSPSCASLNASTSSYFAHITSNYGLKIAPPASGTVTFTNGTGRALTGGAPADANNTVKTTLVNSKVFNWSSTKRITAVIVKGGTKANVYPFNPSRTSYNSLTTVNNNYAISHIEYCYAETTPPPPASITIIKESQPNTSQAFNFTATGQISQNFSLVDNGATGPDRRTFSNLTGFGAGNSVVISEPVALNSGSYSLVQISCASTGTSAVNNNSVSIANRRVEILLEPGEKVTCTFVNAIPTAANVSVSGLVADAEGRGIARAVVTVQNTNTGETRAAVTNSFGRYTISDLPAGDFYIVTVQHRRYQFAAGIQSLRLDDAREDLDFTASPQ